MSAVGQRRRFFRKQLVIPAEHGSWSWFLVPYFVGAAVGMASGGAMNLAVPLVLLGGLAAFLVRQPATAWVRIRRGRGRRADAPLALGWMIGLGLVAGLALLGLLALDRRPLLGLLAPSLVVFLLYLAAARGRRADTRTLFMEVIGAAGLALVAPAAYIAATGTLDRSAWAVWGLMAGQNVLGVLYVRLRLADTHGRPVNRVLVVVIHGLVLLAGLGAAAVGLIPWLAVTIFLGYLLRVGWAAARVRPLVSVKRFGFQEVGVEILGGLVVMTAYWLA